MDAVRRVVRVNHLPRVDADDVVSITIFKILKRWRSAPNAVQDWLRYACQVAHRECCKYRRARRSRIEFVDDEILVRLEAVDRNPSNVSDASLEHAMQVLRTSIRSGHRLALFHLHFERKLPAHEVAQELGCQSQHVQRDIRAMLDRARNLWTSWTAERLNHQEGRAR